MRKLAFCLALLSLLAWGDAGISPRYVAVAAVLQPDNVPVIAFTGPTQQQQDKYGGMTNVREPSRSRGRSCTS